MDLFFFVVMVCNMWKDKNNRIFRVKLLLIVVFLNPLIIIWFILLCKTQLLIFLYTLPTLELSFILLVTLPLLLTINQMSMTLIIPPLVPWLRVVWFESCLPTSSEDSTIILEPILLILYQVLGSFCLS